jgi:hypothetical protein
VTVTVCVHSLLAGVPVVYTGDPLRYLGLTAFLDKFVNKKPKVGGSRCVCCCLHKQCSLRSIAVFHYQIVSTGIYLDAPAWASACTCLGIVPCYLVWRVPLQR